MSWEYRLHFDVAFDVDPGDVPLAEDWTDLSGRLRSRAVCETGSSRTGRGGSSSVDLNNQDRQLDPTNPASPFNLVPMRHARLAVTVNDVRYPLWQGYVENWSPVWPEWNQGTVDVGLVDVFTWLALQDVDLDLPSQPTHERIVQLLDDAGWPATLRDVTDGVVQLSPYEQPSANLRRVLEDTADAEDGELHVNASGQIVFASRHARFDASSVVTVGSSGAPVSSVTPVYDTTWLTNIARVELDDGDVWEARNEASVVAYGPRVFPVRDLSFPSAEAEGLAQWVTTRFSVPLLWLDQVSLNWRNPDVDIATLVQLDVGDLVTFTHTPPGGGAAVYVGHVERLRHEVGNGEARTVLDLSPYFGAGPWLTLDDVSLGLLGEAAGNKLAP